MSEDEERHETEITGGKPGPNWGITAWWVKCSCGYQSGPFQSKREADNDADEHVLAAI